MYKESLYDEREEKNGKRSKGETQIQTQGRPEGTRRVFIKKEALIELYVDKQLPMRRVAEIHNCSIISVRRAMREFGIPIRSIREAMRIATTRRYEYERQSRYRRKE